MNELAPQPTGLPVFNGETWSSHVSPLLEIAFVVKQNKLALAAIAYSVASKWQKKEQSVL
jgi:hypothetical protein